MAVACEETPLMKPLDDILQVDHNILHEIIVCTATDTDISTVSTVTEGSQIKTSTCDNVSYIKLSNVIIMFSTTFCLLQLIQDSRTISSDKRCKKRLNSNHNRK